MPRLDLVDLVTSPSLSSLKLLITSAAFLLCLETVFVFWLRRVVLDFVTRVVDDATLVLGGRGIVASEFQWLGGPRRALRNRTIELAEGCLVVDDDKRIGIVAIATWC